MTIDHKLPLVKGGDNDLLNLVLACYSCNHKKGENSYDFFLFSAFLEDRKASIHGQVLRHMHDAINFTRHGNWSCLCGKYGTSQDDPKSTGCTLFSYGAFYQP